MTLVFYWQCNNDKYKTNQLVGDWTLYSIHKNNVINKSNNLLENEMPEFDFNKKGNYIVFLDDSTLKWLNPFYLVEYNKKLGKKTKKYLDILTKYKIQNDTLKILNLIDSTWINAIITKLKNDTLTFHTEILEYKFIKQTFTLDSSLLFDKIIFSSYGCMGTCPILDIIINKNGHVLFYGADFIEYQGLFKSKLSIDDFIFYRNSFLKARFDTLKSLYIDAADVEGISITFEKDNKIIKYIEDFDYNTSGDLINSYIALMHLNEKLNLKYIEDYNSPLIFSFVIKHHNKEVLLLSKSESFLLWDYLRKGRIVNSIFKALYTLDCTNNWYPRFYGYIKPAKKLQRNNVEILDTLSNTKKWDTIIDIKTDGKYYEFILNDGRKITIDIGFNFFNVNYPQLRIVSN